jgi:(3R)-3-hydroxyacyl-CoA dehydrogenase / 3a,7a,12a-trihydroxy-5b-cholest-24-enoyl-CoA hydratase / enoyl-CoA hydratase 2
MPTLEQVQKVTGYAYPPITFAYTERDVALYALGVGAPADPLDQNELRFVYEHSQEGFLALPTYAAVFGSAMIHHLISGKVAGEIEYNPMMLVHGEQYLEFKKPMPTKGTFNCKPKISAIYDKGSGMVVVTDMSCYDENGDEVVFSQSSAFIRGIGGFGGDRGPSGDINVPPDRTPDAVQSEQTSDKQALVYRLSGDINPLHADPMMAAMGGFEKPILHGLCTFGFAARAVLKHFCGNDPTRFKSIKVRFAKHVFPGNMLTTEMWKESDSKVVFRTKVEERDAVVLSNAAVELNV